MLGLLLTTFSLMQAQACLLLQKTLSARELRVCFEDPEWEQLIGQVLGKVTQVTNSCEAATHELIPGFRKPDCLDLEVPEWVV